MDEEKKLFLKPLNDVKKPFSKKIAGFDIETHGSKNEFVLACLKGDDIDKTFLTKEEFVSFLDGHSMRDYAIVATNLGFDFLGCLFEESSKWKISERSGKIYGFKYYQNGRKNHSISFYDTTNYYPASVEKIGSICKIPKMQHPACFKRLPESKAELDELEAYCRNDAFISYSFFKEFIVKWLNSQKLKLKSTIASMAMDSFRRYYLHKTYSVAPVHIHELVWKAYYGGRTETFKRGTFQKINCYDFNSLYPSVMFEEEYPNPNTMKELNQSSKFYIENYEGVSYVEGFMINHYIPPLPARIDGKLKFPANQIKGFYTHAELRYAIQEWNFKINNYGRGIIYTEKEKIFHDFVKKNYEKRLQQKKNKEPLELMTKLVMNSLYGKFAFNYRVGNSLIPKHQATWKMFKECTSFHEYGDFIEFVNEGIKEPCHYSFPIWSAYCTSYARIKLHKILSKERIQDDVVYCDTDSVFLSNNRKLPSSDKLGDLKHEYSCPEGIFVKPKFYCTNKAKIKGVRNVKTMQDFVKVMQNPKVVNEMFVKYRTAIKSMNHHKHGKLQPNTILQVEKMLDLNDNKRNWLEAFNWKKEQDSCPVMSAL